MRILSIFLPNSHLSTLIFLPSTNFIMNYWKFSTFQKKEKKKKSFSKAWFSSVSFFPKLQWKETGGVSLNSHTSMIVQITFTGSKVTRRDSKEERANFRCHLSCKSTSKSWVMSVERGKVALKWQVTGIPRWWNNVSWMDEISPRDGVHGVPNWVLFQDVCGPAYGPAGMHVTLQETCLMNAWRQLQI